MASVDALFTLQPSSSRVAKEKGSLSNEQRYTLDNYVPSQVLTSQDNSYAIGSQPASSTQGYSSGYMTCSIEPKTQEQPLDLHNPTYDSPEEVRRKPSTIKEVPDCYRASFDAQPLSSSTDSLAYAYWGRPQQSTTRPLSVIMSQLHEVNPSLCCLLKSADRYLHRGHLEKAVQCLEESVSQASSEFPRLQALVSMLLGGVYMQLKRYKSSSKCYLRYLEYCRQVNDFKGVTTTECKLGILYLKQGQLKLAARSFVQYLDNSKLLQDDTGVAAACSNLGTLSRLLASHGYQAALREGREELARESRQTNLYRAIAYFEQHLTIMEQYGDLEKEARTYENLGYCYELLTQYTQAIVCHNKCLDIVRAVGDKVPECYALCHLGNCFRATGKMEDAMEYYHLSYELAQTIDCSPVEIVALLNLGISCELTNNLYKAIEWHTLYLSQTVKRGDQRGQARGLSSLAGLYEETGQSRKAQNCYNKLVDVLKRLGDHEASLKAAKHLATMTQHLKGKRISHATPHTIAPSRGRESLLLTTLERTTSKRNKMGSCPSLKQQTQTLDTSLSYSSRAIFTSPVSMVSKVGVGSLAATWDSRLSPDSTLCFPYTYDFQAPSSQEMDDPRYTLVRRTRLLRGDSPPPPLPPRRYSESELSSDYQDAETTTDYETIASDVSQLTYHPCASLRSRESPSCQGSSHGSILSDYVWADLSQSSYWGSEVSERLEEEVDKEWEQWINLRDVNALCRVVSMTPVQIRDRKNSRDSIKPIHSAPQIDVSSVATTTEDDYDTLSSCTDSSLPL